MSDGQSLGAEHVDMELLTAALDEIRPVLHGDGGDLILHGVDDAGVVRIELLGACGNCPLSIVTLVAGIEALVLKRVPGVAGVISYAPPPTEP
jgi:Fe-S cluster biogenesis protein NfuA